MTPVTIEGSAKCGLQFGLNLTALETWDLAGIDIKVGPAAKASVSYTVRDAGNVLCSDVRTYIYAAGELNPDTVVGKFLKTVWHYTLSKDFLSDDDDNPLKLKVHLKMEHWWINVQSEPEALREAFWIQTAKLL